MMSLLLWLTRLVAFTTTAERREAVAARAAVRVCTLAAKEAIVRVDSGGRRKSTCKRPALAIGLSTLKRLRL